MRRIIFALLLLLSCSGVVAKEVSVADALDVARGVFGDLTRGAELSVAWDSRMFSATRGGMTPTFYVVAPQSGRGFVIVAGDDRVVPVLAYSTRYEAPSYHLMPPNFEAWLRYVDGVVSYVRMHNLSQSEAVGELWSREFEHSDQTLLNTARWSQNMPYNIYCPMDGDALSLTGCTQTAMAIIMYHHRWPLRAQGVSYAYTTDTKGIYVADRDLNHSYDWDNMLDEYVEGEYNDEQAHAVALLMADLGHSFRANYASEATSALPDPSSLYYSYGYSPSCNFFMRDNYSYEGWNELMRSEIEAGRPIFYSGYTETFEGHAFVLDGFDDSDYFHVNWGWGGVSDGFFKLDGLLLDTYLFDTRQWAFLGLHPVRDDEVDNWLYVASPGISMPATEFVPGIRFVIDAISVVNPSILNFDGNIRVGVCDINGEFKSWASDAQSISLENYYATSVLNVDAIINTEIESGDRLSIYYRSKQGDEWHRMMPNGDGIRHEIVLKQPSIGETTSLRFDKRSKMLTISHDADVSASLLFLGSKVEEGVTKSSRSLKIDTRYLRRDDIYTIYLERDGGVESKSYTFTLKNM